MNEYFRLYDGNGNGYLVGDRDSSHEPLLYINIK
jgi:hypothetical protein